MQKAIDFVCDCEHNAIRWVAGSCYPAPLCILLNAQTCNFSLHTGLNAVASGRYTLRQGLGYTLAGKASVCACVFLELHLFCRAEVVCRAGLAAACAETDSL
jgi:hypothetical protein